MRKIETRGDICLKDKLNITYRVAGIMYIEYEDESFRYEIKPNYSVINLLGTDVFQGIPGIDLDLKKEVYVRDNIIPVFISERAPGKNREDLWKLLDDCDMQYLNQLEWLIRTNTTYSGDGLFVQEPQNKSIEVENINIIGNRSAVICRKILEVICYGDTVKAPSIFIDDKNRKEIYTLLIGMYSSERKYLNKQQQNGIKKGIEKGNYKGRKKIKLDSLDAQEIFMDYEAKIINSTKASNALGVSNSTFFRRYKEYKESRQK